MRLENGIAKLVEDFIGSGRPSVRMQSLEARRQGYIESTVLAGEKESQVDVDDFELESLTVHA